MTFNKMIAVVAVLALFGSAAIRAEETPDDKEEAAQIQKITEENKLDTISGKLMLETVEEGKKPPKVVGSLVTKDEAYKVQLLRPDQYKDLVNFNGKEVNMVGHVVSKDGGKIIYFEELEFAAPRAPSRTKRGGF